MAFFVNNLTHYFRQFQQSKKLWIAYSGGMDSHVLLHVMCQLNQKNFKKKICAVHINHGLHPDAFRWTEHCRRTCDDLSITCHCIDVDARPLKGSSPEAVARKVRYTALQKLIGEDEYLLVAHHADDQAETVLLQLMRGSGPPGLAAMPEVSAFGKGFLLRPLLGYSQQQLREYALEHQLEWIDDESNADISFDRNFLRHTVIPNLKLRWPSLSTTLGRVASHQQHANQLLEQVASVDLQKITYRSTNNISVTELSKLTDVRQKNVIRCWIKKLQLPVPTDKQLQHILSDVLNSAYDAQPCVRWSGCEIRRYGDLVYAMSPIRKTSPLIDQHWDLTSSLTVNGNRLTAIRTLNNGIDTEICDKSGVDVRFRKNGERFRIQGKKQSTRLKKYFQSKRVPPWYRDRIPLIFIEDELVAITGYWSHPDYQPSTNRSGYVFEYVP